LNIVNQLKNTVKHFFDKVISEKLGNVTKKGNSCGMLGLMQR